MTLDPKYHANPNEPLADDIGNIRVFPTPVPVRKMSKTEQIYDLLRKGPFGVANLAYAFGCSQAAIKAIVQDIRRKGGFVLSARSGKHQYYAIASGPRTYAKLLRDRRQHR
ncbi:winged helix-turn-helix domain-containing protein [Mesorhizobium sp. AR10]|uniref:winged helix-turn-helix domain-containing protein n=1 Tax=Mesorhizobium sp. AR10 TaxID=2865839 RepID=UPI00215F1FF7|nr:winged helix-turn-helix domain-containing protein [Mesorhizobium sp. AR10]UVK39037.1 winged helix-turn-helix domain-containing protein [Mesorhizobium sp. AR10]